MPTIPSRIAPALSNIVHAQGYTAIVAEIELGEIPVKVLLGAVLVGSAHTALEDREPVLDGVGMHVAANVFLARVLDALVTGKHAIHAVIEAAFIGDQAALAGHVGSDERRDVLLIGLNDMEGSNRTATLDKTEDGAFVAGARLALQ